jgi:hypothetical protein
MKGLNLNSGSDAEVAELVDALASGASELLARGGSSPLLGTIFYKTIWFILDLFTQSIRTSMCEMSVQVVRVHTSHF